MPTKPLHQAARIGDLDLIRRRLSLGEGLHEYDHEGLQPLHAAAESGRAESVELLLDLGAGIEARTWPFYYDEVETHWDGEKLSYEAAGKRFNQRPDGGTALHLAAEYGHLEVIRVLLGRGARVSAPDENHQTPLHLAVINGRFEAAELLVRHGADLAALDCNGSVPRDWLRVHFAGRIAFEDTERYHRWDCLLASA
jgi:ankyrin repeat protein